MNENDPGSLADDLEQQADQLEEHNARLRDDVQGVRQDWERKRSDPAVPGATPPEVDGDQPEASTYPAKDEPEAHQ